MTSFAVQDLRQHHRLGDLPAGRAELQRTVERVELRGGDGIAYFVGVEALRALEVVSEDLNSCGTPPDKTRYIRMPL
jgi:hypothetical protein